MRNWRPLTWVILVINVLFLWWLISAFGADGGCEGLSGSELDACETGSSIGAGLAVVMIFVLWAIFDVILGVIWMVTKGSTRDCPTCGRRVKKGQVVCQSCGHDFRQPQWQQYQPS